MVSLLVVAHFSIVSLTDCSQKLPLFDLESLLQEIQQISFRVIHEIVTVLIYKFGHPEI